MHPVPSSYHVMHPVPSSYHVMHPVPSSYHVMHPVPSSYLFVCHVGCVCVMWDVGVSCGVWVCHVGCGCVMWDVGVSCGMWVCHVGCVCVCRVGCGCVVWVYRVHTLAKCCGMCTLHGIALWGVVCTHVHTCCVIYEDIMRWGCASRGICHMECCLF